MNSPAIIRQRRDLASAWTSANPILHSGQLGFELDTRKLKIGNGTDAWNNLPYVGTPLDATYLVKDANGDLTAERVVGDSTSITANWGTAGAVTFERAAFTGDVTADANSNSLTLANTAVNAGSYTAANITVDTKGRITDATSNPLNFLSNANNSTQAGYFGDIYLYDDSSPSHYLQITNSADLTAARVFNLNVNNADRTVSLSGNLTVSADATVSGTNTGDQTIGNGALTLGVSGVGLSGDATFNANQGTAATFTVTSNATNANTGGAIVARDTSGNFSAGTITAALSGNATTATTLATSRTFTVGGTGKSFNGSGDVSWTLSEIGALSSATTSTQSGYFGDIYLWDDSTPSHYLQITNSANLTAARLLSINVNDANRTVSLSGNLTLANNFTTAGNFGLTLTTTNATNATLPAGTVTLAATSGKLNQFAATTSSDLAEVISDKTGTGILVFNNTPALTTPNIGAATGTSLALTGGGLTSRLAANQDAVTIAGRAGGTSSFGVTVSPTTLTGNRTLTLADGNTVLTTGTMATTQGALSQFAATTSDQLAGVISNETGHVNGALLVFNTSPTFTTSVITNSLSFDVFNTIATTVNAFGAATALIMGATTGTTTIRNDLKVSTNIIKSSTSTTALTLSGADVAVAGDLTVSGNDIKSSTSTTALTLSGADVAVAGDLTVSGNDIKSSADTVLTLSNDDVTVKGNITSNEGYRIGSSALNTQAGAYTLAATDNGKIILMNNGATAVNLTVGTAAGTTGFTCTIVALGTGKVTIVQSGTTLNWYGGTGNVTIAGQYGSAALVAYSANTFSVSGTLQ